MSTTLVASTDNMLINMSQRFLDRIEAQHDPKNQIPLYQCNFSATDLKSHHWFQLYPNLLKGKLASVGFLPKQLQVTSRIKPKEHIRLIEHKNNMIVRTLLDQHVCNTKIANRVHALVNALHRVVGIPDQKFDIVQVIQPKDVIAVCSDRLVNEHTSLRSNGTHVLINATEKGFEDTCRKRGLFYKPMTWQGKLGKDRALTELKSHELGNSTRHQIEAEVKLDDIPGTSWTVYEEQFNGSVVCPFRVLNCDGERNEKSFNHYSSPFYHGYEYGCHEWIIMNNQTKQTIRIPSLTLHLIENHNFWLNHDDYMLDYYAAVKVLCIHSASAADKPASPLFARELSSSSSSSSSSSVSGASASCEARYDIDTNRVLPDDQRAILKKAIGMGKWLFDNFYDIKSIPEPTPSSSSSSSSASSSSSSGSSLSYTVLGSCNSCGKSTIAKKLSRCSRCWSVWYCSKECQRVDWTTKHKSVCIETKRPPS
jgi:hypothetical protein